MQSKASDKTPAATELDDSALDSVVGGTSLGVTSAGPLYTPTPKGPAGGGGDDGTIRPLGGDHSTITPGGSGGGGPNGIQFPK
jgi:hypothetical protein